MRSLKSHFSSRIFFSFFFLWIFLHQQLSAETTNQVYSSNRLVTQATNQLSRDESTEAPFSTIFIFSLNSGLNFFILDQEEVRSRYQLSDLRNTFSFSFGIESGVVLQNHWIALLIYGYSKREDYHYRDHYFAINSRALELRYHHYLQLEGSYLLWDYWNDYNISFGLAVGWLRKYMIFSRIDDITSGKDLLSFEQRLDTDLALTSLGMKIYYRLRKEGIIYLGFKYHFMFPRFETYPQLVLGIDVNIDFTPQKNEKLGLNPFFQSKSESLKETLKTNKLNKVDPKN